jgi:STE24 endopeptidase
VAPYDSAVRPVPTVAQALAAAAGAGAAALAVRRDARRAAPPPAEPARLEDWFAPESLRRNRRFRRVSWALAVAGAPLGPGLSVAAWRTADRWAPALARAAGGRYAPAGAAFGAGTALVQVAAGLPLGAARYAWGRRFGIVTQPPRAWLGDVGKATALEAGLAAGLGAALATLLHRAPRAWPLGLAAVSGAGTLALVVISPRLIEPLFQRTRPLDDPELEASVLELARRSGVPAKEVVVSDASRRTTAPNAYVSGVGPTRRIVLFDTLLRDMPADEVRFVVAHELAHAARRHVRRRLVTGAAFAVPGCLALGALVAWRTGDGPPDVALALRRAALAAAGAAALGAVAGPLGSWLSRAHEREADWSAVQATGDPEAAIRTHQSLVHRALGVPDPPRWVQVLFGSHPTALERIGLALRARA